MKELEEKASDLLYVHSIINPFHDDEEDIEHAIQSVNYTIETLENLIIKIDTDANSYLSTRDALIEQIELKKILEGRL